MWKEHDEIPPALIEALRALAGEDETADGAVIYCIRPDPRKQLTLAFKDGLDEGHRFADVLGEPLESPDAIIQALKADGRVHVTQTIELDPEIAPYL